MKTTFTFGFLKTKKSFSKTAYKIGDQNISLTSNTTISGNNFLQITFVSYLTPTFN